MKRFTLLTRAVWVEIGVLAVVVVLVFIVCSIFDVAEGLATWLQAGEAFKVDELLPTSLVAVLLLAVFAFRRLREARNHCQQLLDAERHIHRLAYYDSLTGLPNRTLVLDRLQQAMHRAERNHQSMALVFLDLDHFKWINDELGHPVGDKLLQAIAERIAPHVRDSDTFGRLSGDEFVLILSEVHETNAIRTLIDRVYSQFQRPFFIENHTLHCTTSMGVAIYPEDAATLSELLSCADRAMYRAKADGKNSFRFFSPLLDRARPGRVYHANTPPTSDKKSPRQK